MGETLTPEKWGRKESAAWWSAGQAARQQLYGAATEFSFKAVLRRLTLSRRSFNHDALGCAVLLPFWL